MSYFEGPGFLGSGTTLGADLSLVLIVVSAILFTIGWRLAVAKRFEAHRWVQTVAAGLTAVVVLAWMIRSFVLYVAPEITTRLGESTYAVGTLHAVVGAIALVLGLFVVLRANGLAPRALRFEAYKLFMRTSYALFMLSTLIGVVFYLVLFA